MEMRIAKKIEAPALSEMLLLIFIMKVFKYRERKFQRRQGRISEEGVGQM